MHPVHRTSYTKPEPWCSTCAKRAKRIKIYYFCQSPFDFWHAFSSFTLIFHIHHGVSPSRTIEHPKIRFYWIHCFTYKFNDPKMWTIARQPYQFPKRSSKGCLQQASCEASRIRWAARGTRCSYTTLTDKPFITAVTISLSGSKDPPRLAPVRRLRPRGPQRLFIRGAARRSGLLGVFFSFWWFGIVLGSQFGFS